MGKEASFKNFQTIHKKCLSDNKTRSTNKEMINQHFTVSIVLS